MEPVSHPRPNSDHSVANPAATCQGMVLDFPNAMQA